MHKFITVVLSTLPQQIAFVWHSYILSASAALKKNPLKTTPIFQIKWNDLHFYYRISSEMVFL